MSLDSHVRIKKRKFLKVNPAILLIEDNSGDVRILLNAFNEIDWRPAVTVIENGEKALSYLGLGAHPHCGSRPDFILIDLNLPGKNGFEFLSEVVADRELSRIPAAILTSSEVLEDMMKGYDCGVDFFLTKPCDWSGYVTLARAIKNSWSCVRGESIDFDR